MSSKNRFIRMASLLVACLVATGWADAAPGVDRSAAPASQVSAAPMQPQAVAQPAAAPVSDEASRASVELMHLQEDTMVLKARLKKLDAQMQVNERETALDHLNVSVGNDDIQVDSTEGFGNAMLATVELSGGRQLDVHTGDTLPGNLRVVSIKPGRVVVQTASGKRRELAVSVQNLAAAHGAVLSGIPSIPALPFSR